MRIEDSILKILLVSFSIVLLLVLTLFIPPVDGEQKIKPIKDKYIVTKNAAFLDSFGSTDTIQIDLIDLRNSTELKSESSVKDLKIIISDFVPTSKGRLSNADDILQSQSIILEKVINENNGIEIKTEEGKEIQFIKLKSNLTQFTVTTNTTEKDTVTYSGKIYLKNESTFVPIDVDVVIKHDPLELVFFNFIGIGTGIISAVGITKGWCGKCKYNFFGVIVEFNNSKGPWILVVVTTIVGIPSSLLVNNLFIGSVMFDIGIALGLGFLILVSLLKEKEDPSDDLKIELKLPKNNQRIDRNDILEEELNKNHLLKGWFGVCEDEKIEIEKK